MAYTKWANGQGSFAVINTETGQAKSVSTSEAKADKQLQLLNVVSQNPDFKEGSTSTWLHPKTEPEPGE